MASCVLANSLHSPDAPVWLISPRPIPDRDRSVAIMVVARGAFALSLKEKSAMRRSNRTFTPRLEKLDERTVPAVVSTFANGTLTITGDEADNQVSVGVVGNNVVVNADGNVRVFRNASSLSEIDIDLAGGNDTLRLNLGSSIGRNDDVSIAVDTGDGNDTVVVRAFAVGRDANLGSISIDTGAGEDRVRFAINALGRGATLDASVNLGDDADTFEWVGRTIGRDAAVNLDLDAGLGADTVSTNFGVVGRGANFGGSINLGMDQSVADTDVDNLTLASGRLGRGATATIEVDAALTGSAIDTIASTNLNSTVDLTVNDVA